jgi:hypothetical protein
MCDVRYATPFHLPELRNPKEFWELPKDSRRAEGSMVFTSFSMRLRTLRNLVSEDSSFHFTRKAPLMGGIGVQLDRKFDEARNVGMGVGYRAEDSRGE